MQRAGAKWSWHGFLIAGLLATALLGACGGGDDADPATVPETPTTPVNPNPPTVPEAPTTPVNPDAPVTPANSIASVAISHDAQGTTPPTRVVATFSARVLLIQPGLITSSGNCTTLPAVSTALDSAGRVLTVTLGTYQCDPGQTLTLTVDPSKVQLENATLADTSVWTRSFTMATPPQQIGGSVSGLAGTLILANHVGEALNVFSDGNFLFPAPVAYGAAYAVSIAVQPPGQSCSVGNGVGTVQGSAIRNVAVVCSTNAYPVGGTVTGLSGSVTLRLNGGSPLTLNTNGSFGFNPALAQGSAYNVTVFTQPASQTCTVANGSGTVNYTVANVQVVCSANTYTVGGTVSGLSGALVLQNNGTDNLVRNTAGSFTFANPVAVGAAYITTVQTQPVGQTCTVSNGSGILGGANVTNISVTCTNDITTLSVPPTAIVPVSLSGTTGFLTVTNTGGYVARNISVNLPGGWNGVTVDASGCTTVAPGNSCNLIFSSTQAYVGSAAVTIQGDNTSSAQAAFGFSIAGYLVYQVSGPLTAQVVGLEQTPREWGGYLTAVGPAAQSFLDGSTNTDAIVLALGQANAAAQYCRSIDPAVNWYLPAACEWGGSGCPLPGQGLQKNAVDLGLLDQPPTVWTSTESSQTPNLAALAYSASSGSSILVAKNTALPFRCVASVSW